MKCNIVKIKYKNEYNGEIISTNFLLPKGYNTNTIELDNVFSSFFISLTNSPS